MMAIKCLHCDKYDKMRKYDLFSSNMSCKLLTDKPYIITIDHYK